MTGDPFLGC